MHVVMLKMRMTKQEFFTLQFKPNYMKTFLIGILLFFYCNANSQELFVLTEPASNMPSKSVGVRLSNYIMNIDSSNQKSYHLMPEIMVSVTNKLMAHLALVTSNRLGKVHSEGISLYTKYRFLSNDNVHRHFRMAAFGRYSYNISPIHMQEINLYMHNSGYEVGTVATQLFHKTAINGTVSLQRAITTNKSKFIYPNLNNAINYSFSIGQLIHPKTYTSYKQTNVNVMLELIGQHNIGNNKGFIDIAPSLQFIINSVARIDLAYRTNLNNQLIRSFSKGLIIKFEYNFFNAFK